MMMKIRIPNGDAARGIMALVRQGYTVHCLPGQVYYVPPTALEHLKKLGIAYDQLGEEPLDRVIKEIRDSVTSKV